jgi:hypothetical protein
MIAYNPQYLDNRAVQAEAAEAFAKKVITEEEYHRIRGAYPYTFYTPNIYVRIGLFLLTVLASACGFGLFILMGAGSARSVGISFIIFGAIAYVGLEFFIRRQGMYRSGVDDALLWVGGGMILAGIDISFNTIPPSVQSLLVLVLAAWGVLRYADRLMALVAYGALLSLIFHLTVGGGAVARALLPFLMMVVSVVAYLLASRLSAAERLRNYHSCLVLLRVATLVSFYLAGNYYVVRELNAFISGGSGPVALGWLWWVLTAITPVFYIGRGLVRKDVVFLWTGLALIAATIFTVRYYYHLLPAELAMIIGGSVLIIGVYCLSRYLHVPKHGFTAASPEEPDLLGDLPMEGLILAESFKAAAAQPEAPGFRFGGGTGGGGGAGGDF